MEGGGDWSYGWAGGLVSFSSSSVEQSKSSCTVRIKDNVFSIQRLGLKCNVHPMDPMDMGQVRAEKKMRSDGKVSGFF